MKVTIKGVVHLYKSPYSAEAYQFHMYDMSDMGPEYVPVMPHEFEVEIPDDFDPRPQQIAALKAKKQEVLAEAQAKATDIEGQIQRLLAIEHKPEQPA